MFETHASINSALAYGVIETTLLLHHIMGIGLFILVSFTGSYQYLATIVLIQVLT